MKTEIEKNNKENNDVLHLLKKRKKKTKDHLKPTRTTPCKREHVYAPHHVERNQEVPEEH
jgi:hypothetical protein